MADELEELLEAVQGLRRDLRRDLVARLSAAEREELAQRVVDILEERGTLPPRPPAEPKPRREKSTGYFRRR